MRGSGAYGVLVGARVFVEAVAFASLAGVAHALAAGREPLPLVATTLLLYGAGLILVTLMREIGTERRSSAVVVLTLGTGVAAALFLPMRAGADWLALLSRGVTFGLLAEAFLWRQLTIARGAARWSDARNAVPFAAIAIAIAALWPATVEREALPGLALLMVAVSGLALSLARTNEELALLRGTTGSARASSATGVTVVIALAAILAAAFAPSVQDAFARLGELLGPVVSQVLFWVLLPFAYVVGFIVELLRPLVSGKLPTLPELVPQRSPEEEAALLRELEKTRPFVFGAFELVIVAIALVFALVLVERMLRERRMQLVPGVTLERGSIGGLGLLDTLRSLRPRRERRPHPPRDDGSPASALRVLYWRFLALAEARGAGWRAAPETPAEHETRISARDGAWRAGEPIVRAFEDLRYGDIDPAPDTLARARAAMRTLEAPRRAS